uniref:Si:ch73-74h11.1 n=1 Tax=Amphiprion percula TaxID=161767 RepID=A0A3P8U4L9_AMPPE
KREWILPPCKLEENTDYSHLSFIAKIRSDKSKHAKVEYYLSGPGADKPPYNLFVVDHETGFVRVTGKLDRENHPYYNLTGVARYANGTPAEDDIPLTVIVLDQNDNPPYFELHTGNISESSKEETFIMQIEGKDNDKPGSPNAEIAYRILSQEPEGTGNMFRLDEKTGKLYVKEPTLDRETHDFYKLVVEGTDMGGAAGGLKGTGTVEIKILDINDNLPTLEKSEYAGSVDENVADVVVMRIKAVDKDLEHTDNWLTKFTIAKGNEDNLFSIETDKETNEGILKLIKAVDFEEVQNLELGLLIENIAPLPKPSVPSKSYPIKIAVNNVPEGPAFVPDTKDVPVSEDPNEAPDDGIIAVFAAVDPDTGKPAEDVSYAKAYDPDNWFTIDEETAEIKLNKVPDRESPFLVNGTYIAKILAMTKDMPSKTATGTIAIQVKDSNDHCPTLTTTHSDLCSDEKTVIVTGFDEDDSPNGAPFTFRIIPEGTRETSAALHSSEALWPGLYKLQVVVEDAQGVSCPTSEIFSVDVCTCVERDDCKLKAARQRSTSTELGAPVIGLLLMAMCLLLCEWSFNKYPVLMGITYNPFATFNKQTFGFPHTTPLYEDMALPDSFLNDYYSQVLCWLCMQLFFCHQIFYIHPCDEMLFTTVFVLFLWSKQKAVFAVPVKDGLLEYEFEGQGSPTGSLGCCSLLDSNNDLLFLTDLGPKFKTLAEICSPPTPTPKLTCTSTGAVKTTVDIVEPVFKSKLERIVDTELTDIKTEKVMSSTNILKSSVNTVSTAPPPMTVSHSKITNTSHSSNITHSGKLPYPPQTVVLQQQPIYYTTSPVLQPMNYVVQPHLQNTVLLADGSRGANFPGLYVVSGPQNPSGFVIGGPQDSPSGLIIQHTESSRSPESPQSPAGTTSPISPTLLLPGSPDVSPGSVPAEGWKIIGPNSDGNYMLVKNKSSPDETEGLDLGSSQGILPGGLILEWSGDSVISNSALSLRVIIYSCTNHQFIILCFM